MAKLQIFAEGDGDGGVHANGDGVENGKSGDKNHPLSFDDFLKQGGNQAEFDRRVQKATQTAVANAKQKWKALTDDKMSEAERLAQMTKEEKTGQISWRKN